MLLFLDRNSYLIFLIDGIQIFSESLMRIRMLRFQLIVALMSVQPKRLCFSFWICIRHHP